MGWQDWISRTTRGSRADRKSSNWRDRVPGGRSTVLMSVGGTIGAAVMFILDPARGRRRRSLARDKVVATVHDASEQAQRIGAMASGLSQRVTHMGHQPEEPANDQVLEQRVQSEIFRDPNVPKGDINIAVADGVVTLRGILPHPEDIRSMVDRVGKVPGVKGVESYLHLPNTPAPNKEDALLST